MTLKSIKKMGEERTKRCRLHFDHVLNPRLLRAMQTTGIDKTLRGTNIVAQIDVAAGAQMVVDLKSGYFNGRTYKERLVVKRVTRFLQETAANLTKHRGTIDRLMLVDWINKNMPEVKDEDDDESVEREFIRKLRQARKADDRRINDMIKYCLDTAVKME